MPRVAFTNSSGFGPLPRLLEAAHGPRLVARIFQSEDLPLSILSGDGSWVPMRGLMAVFERSAAELGDEFFGLHVGQEMQPEDFGLWARYVVSAPSLRGMISRMRRAVRFHQSGGEIELDVVDDIAVWRYRVAEPGTVGRRHHAEHALWPMLTALRRYAGPDYTPIRIECAYDRPRCWRRLEEEFGTSLRFGTPANAIVFERRLLDVPALVATSLENAVTCGDLRRIVRRRPPATIVDAARAILQVRITEQFTDIDGTARLLGLSARSLQRHLAEQNLSFRDLLEQVRMQRALDLLIDTPASITDIAFSLGYNDITSFSRAFRRWRGQPPNQIRQSIRRK